MDTIDIADSIWNKATEFMHQSGTHMESAHIGKKDDLYLWQLSAESRVSFTFMCPYEHLCNCRAGVRISENKRNLILEFKGSHDKNSHRLRSMSARRCAAGVGGFRSNLLDNDDSDDSAENDVFNRMRSAIPYSPVLLALRKKGSAECHYRRNLNAISDSDSNSDTSPEPLRKKNSVISGPAYVDPSSMEATEVEYATEYYDESPDRPSLSPATKKRHHDEREDDMDAMSSMSESEVQTIMDARERKKQEETRMFLEYRRSLKGEEESQFCRGSFLTLIPPVQPPAATLPRTAVPPPWHSSASSQMDRLRVRSPRTCATQVRAGVL